MGVLGTALMATRGLSSRTVYRERATCMQTDVLLESTLGDLQVAKRLADNESCRLLGLEKVEDIIDMPADAVSDIVSVRSFNQVLTTHATSAISP
jgi:hypothetical protein